MRGVSVILQDTGKLEFDDNFEPEWAGATKGIIKEHPKCGKSCQKYLSSADMVPVKAPSTSKSEVRKMVEVAWRVENALLDPPLTENLFWG